MISDYQTKLEPKLMRKTDIIRGGSRLLDRPIKFIYFNSFFKVVEIHLCDHSEPFLAERDKQLTKYFIRNNIEARKIDGGDTNNDG